MQREPKHTYEFNLGYLEGATERLINAYDSGASIGEAMQNLRAALETVRENLKNRESCSQN